VAGKKGGGTPLAKSQHLQALVVAYSEFIAKRDI
jgi:hypothetical protein